jgi:hypothetical protein
MHQQLWGYKVEEKLYLGGTRRKKVEYHWSRKCGSLDVSQPYGPSRLVTGIALPLLRIARKSFNIEVSHRREQNVVFVCLGRPPGLATSGPLGYWLARTVLLPPCLPQSHAWRNRTYTLSTAHNISRISTGCFSTSWKILYQLWYDSQRSQNYG